MRYGSTVLSARVYSQLAIIGDAISADCSLQRDATG